MAVGKRHHLPINWFPINFAFTAILSEKMEEHQNRKWICFPWSPSGLTLTLEAKKLKREGDGKQDGGTSTRWRCSGVTSKSVPLLTCVSSHHRCLSICLLIKTTALRSAGISNTRRVKRKDETSSIPTSSNIHIFRKPNRITKRFQEKHQVSSSILKSLCIYIFHLYEKEESFLPDFFLLLRK